jgi:hypothetical protein
MKQVCSDVVLLIGISGSGPGQGKDTRHGGHVIVRLLQLENGSANHREYECTILKMKASM